MRLLVRCILALSVIVLGFTSMMGGVPTVRANLEHCDNPIPFTAEFGGGSDFSGWCPPEFSTCEDQDGDGCIDVGGGGGGGGGDWVPYPANCLTATNQGLIVNAGWRVSDYGRCSSTTACEAIRDRGNVGRAANGPRWHCWASQYEPGSTGPHLVIGFRYRCGGIETTTRAGTWTVTNLGLCSSVAVCTEKAYWLNLDATLGAWIAFCWTSAEEPGSSGQHLVLARQRGL